MTRAVRREGKGKKIIVAIASYWGEDYACACVGGRIKNNIFWVLTFLRLCHELSNERLANTFQRLEENTHYHEVANIDNFFFLLSNNVFFEEDCIIKFHNYCIHICQLKVIEVVACKNLIIFINCCLSFFNKSIGCYNIWHFFL